MGGGGGRCVKSGIALPEGFTEVGPESGGAEGTLDSFRQNRNRTWHVKRAGLREH